MSYQDRIYGQCGLCPERNQTTRSINTSSDLYIFNKPGFNMSGATKIDCTSPPNSGLTSGDTGVYILSGQTGITVDFIFTANTQSFTDLNQSKFKYSVYKYNTSLSGFNINAIYTSPIIEWSSFSATSATTQSIPINSLSVDGDYIVKAHYVNNVATELGTLLGETYDTIKSITGDEYAIYQPDRDFYFVCLNEADVPSITQGTNSPGSINAFVVTSIELAKNQTGITISDTFQSYIVALNGMTLAENYDYSINIITSGSVSTSIITLFSPAVVGDILTVAYISVGGNNQIINKIIDVSYPIVSGATNGQGSNDIYYNTTTGKFEVYIDTEPVSENDIMVTVNGAILANNIDYYQSTSNTKRIILNGSIFFGDIINVYYNGLTNVTGTILTPNPTISWSITTAPINTNGRFTVEVSTATTFNIIATSAVTNYVVGEFNYNSSIPITGNYGDVYYYRIKNEKDYYTLCNSIVKSIKYTDAIPITIGINSINAY